MHKLIGKKKIIIGIILSSMMFTGCGNTSADKNITTSTSTKVEQNKDTSSNSKKQDLLTALNNAKEVKTVK